MLSDVFRQFAMAAGVALLFAGPATAETIVSQLGTEALAYEPGSTPATLGWGPDDRAYPDRCVINPVDGAEMVWVPPGSFRMGITDEELAGLWEANGWDPDWKYTLYDARPAHVVTLTRGFWLYRHAVTIGQYALFLAAITDDPTTAPDEPDAKVPTRASWCDAELYGGWAEGELVTEAQREWAARGPENLLWPWGNDWDPDQCNSGDYWAGRPLNDLETHKAWFDGFANPGTNAMTGEVGSQPGNTSWCGACDLAGKLWEWCRDWYAHDYYAISPAEDPEGLDEGEQRVRRGGGWSSLAHNTLSCYRSGSEPDAVTCGFRLVIVPGLEP